MISYSQTRLEVTARLASYALDWKSDTPARCNIFGFAMRLLFGKGYATRTWMGFIEELRPKGEVDWEVDWDALIRESIAQEVSQGGALDEVLYTYTLSREQLIDMIVSVGKRIPSDEVLTRLEMAFNDTLRTGWFEVVLLSMWERYESRCNLEAHHGENR